MQTLSLEAMVDEIVATLAQQRQVNRQRDQAYVALARAILTDDRCESDTPRATAA